MHCIGDGNTEDPSKGVDERIGGKRGTSNHDGSDRAACSRGREVQSKKENTNRLKIYDVRGVESAPLCGPFVAEREGEHVTPAPSSTCDAAAAVSMRGRVVAGGEGWQLQGGGRRRRVAVAEIQGVNLLCSGLRQAL